MPRKQEENPKTSRRREIIKISAKVNEIETTTTKKHMKN
jgi:hypothetical protein